MTARKRVTVALTWALVAMSVAFCLAGFIDQGYDAARIAALMATLAIFSWLLSESLETFLEHHRQKTWRQYTTAACGVVLIAVEIHLVHYGLAWLFGDLGAPLLYALSAGFTLLTVTAKATFGHTYPEPEAEPDSHLGDVASRLEAVAGRDLKAA